MALSDYYLCDVCDRKTFYDAEVQYKNDITQERNLPVGVGDMRVLCPECATQYDIIIAKKGE